MPRNAGTLMPPRDNTATPRPDSAYRAAASEQPWTWAAHVMQFLDHRGSRLILRSLCERQIFMTRDTC